MSTEDFAGRLNGLTVVQLLPPLLQAPQLLLALVIRAVCIQVVRQLCHALVHRHHDTQGISGGSHAQTEGGGKEGELVSAGTGLVALQEGVDGQAQVGDGAEAVERREELLAVVEEVGGLLAGVDGGDVRELEHGHDQWRLEDGAT